MHTKFRRINIKNSVSDPNPVESANFKRIKNPETGKNGPQKRKVKKFHVLERWMFSLVGGGFSAACKPVNPS
jgi:hypothetical protein